MADVLGQTGAHFAVRVNEPDMYDVLMLNDDFTTMEFVVEVLCQVFFHSTDEANRLMMDIHKKGRCVVGTYTCDIAQTKVEKATHMARKAGFPLRLQIKKCV